MDETDWGKFKDEFLSLLKKVVPLLSGKSVLNLFADGSLCCYLRKLGARVIGIDRGDAVQERRGAEREDEPNPDPYSFADLGKERFDLIFSAMPFSAAAVAKMSRSVARMINHEGFSLLHMASLIPQLMLPSKATPMFYKGTGFSSPAFMRQIF